MTGPIIFGVIMLAIAAWIVIPALIDDYHHAKYQQQRRRKRGAA
jgi:predicted RND superfamily exporter protein